MNGGFKDDHHDKAADTTILACLDIEHPTSFFLYAGAGSGKTRSLVEAVRTVCRDQGRRLSLSGQQIGVITFTNAACDEIKQRLEYNPLVEVSTIHSFAWSLVSGYDGDIRKWLESRLIQDIAELEKLQAKGRAGTKASIDRASSIESKRRRHTALNEIQRFIYSPSGDNRARDALNHAEVIAMTSDFLTSKPGLRRLLITRFPILLIDECQDTNRQLIEALLEVQTQHSNSFCLGLFGDTMQRIYADGKTGLAEAIPNNWARPRKEMNHRCPTRVIELINAVRSDVDGVSQRPRSDAARGVIRLFILPEATNDKTAVEAEIAVKMAHVTGDAAWLAGSGGIKTLALEHMMSARRFGFQNFFSALWAVERIRTGLLDGKISGIGLFTREILPLVKALRDKDRFAAAAVIRRTSPLLDHKALEDAGTEQRALLDRARIASDGLLALIDSAEPPTLGTVLRYVAETRLFTIPDVLAPFATPDDAVTASQDDEELDQMDQEDEEAIKSETGGWRNALEAPFDEIDRYDCYVRGVSQFDTHQGVKGLEFPRVMVVVSDDEARGFMFNYDKLFGVKDKSDSDRNNEADGKETTIDRTRRLFYVTCSRAEESLAIVYYTSNPSGVRDAMVNRGWFETDEIELVP